MYAVVRTGGKQVRVAAGDSVRVEKLAGEIGEQIEFDEILLVGGDNDEKVVVGTPTVAGAKVVGTITDQGRGPKIIIFKSKRRKQYRRKQGHRQAFTEIHVDKVEG
jgi:large subunit ribosomal protein L21